MRFLFTALHPPAGGVAFGGVASWIKTICKEFTARGHECVTMGPGYPAPEGRFDVGVLSNLKYTRRAARWCDSVLAVSHGIVDDEGPNERYRTVYTSEEVRDRWGGDGDVVRQPIDLDFWREGGRERTDFVFYSYRAPETFELEHVARRLGLNFVWLRAASADEARSALQSAALVAASGRAALEAMACGAPTMICDWRDYNGGPLVCMDMDKAMRANYSGRGGVDPSTANMERIAQETMAFQKPRERVETHHDSRIIASKLLDLCLQS